MSQARPAPGRRRPKEPITYGWLWVALGVTVLVLVPWWAPTGSVEPTVLGLPGWFVVSVLASLVFSGLTCWACLRAWNVVEDEEEAAAAAATAATERGEGR